MTHLHPTAYVESGAELGEGVRLGAFTYVEAGAVIGARTVLESHVTIKSGVTMGVDGYVAQGAVIGGAPQDVKFAGEPTTVVIGDRCTVREYVTIHRATGEGNATVMGDDCFVMAYSHLGHNVTLERKVTLANNVGLSGHVTVEELVTIGGMTGVHQYVRIGRAAMVGGMTRVVRDVPPYMLVEGHDQEVHDINAVGLRRLGVTSESRLALHKACKLLYKSQLGLRNAMEIVRREVPATPEVLHLLTYEDRRQLGRNGRGDQR